ncbi:hypothetical protein ILUMI_04710, partial [Ignelater luminosus]
MQRSLFGVFCTKKRNIEVLSRVFTKEKMSRFSIKALDEKVFIHRVAIIVGMAEIHRREELYNMADKNIEDREATLLANKGVSILGLKWHGGWKSLAVTEKYVKDSPRNKIQYGERILHVGNKLSSLSSAKFS